MRPAQWVKNLFVAAPALFAKDHALVDPSIFLKAAFATGTFILLASSVYILNDVLDIEKTGYTQSNQNAQSLLVSFPSRQHWRVG